MVMKTKKRHGLKHLLKHKVLLLMLLPGVVFLLINNYLPMFGIVIAFKNINYVDGILGSPWVGLDNFKFLFATSDAWIITRNTVLYNFVFIVLNLLFAVSIAVALNEPEEQAGRQILSEHHVLPLLPVDGGGELSGVRFSEC